MEVSRFARIKLRKGGNVSMFSYIFTPYYYIFSNICSYIFTPILIFQVQGLHGADRPRGDDVVDQAGGGALLRGGGHSREVSQRVQEGQFMYLFNSCLIHFSALGRSTRGCTPAWCGSPGSRRRRPSAPRPTYTSSTVRRTK